MFFKWPDNQKPLKTSDRVPYHLRKYALVYAQCLYEEYGEGEVLTQVAFGIDYSIWLHYFFMKQDIVVYPDVKMPMLAINYMRIAEIAAKLAGPVPVFLRAAKCHMFCIPGDIIHEVVLKKGISSCMHINFHPDYVVPLAVQYPVFGQMLSQAIERMDEGEQRLEIDVTSEMDKEIEKIIKCKLGVGERELFFQARIRDLLRMYSSALAKTQEIEAITNPKQKVLARVEHYIDQHLDRDLSIDALTVYARMSRASLASLFSEKYKRGVHSFIIEKRMAKAAERLIETDDLVSNIAMQTSDMTFAAFSAAFKKFHGFTPFEYRNTFSQNRKK